MLVIEAKLKGTQSQYSKLTLIILAKGFKLLAEYLNSTVGHRSSDLKKVKAQGEIDLWLKNGDALALSRLDELRTKDSWESPAILP